MEGDPKFDQALLYLQRIGFEDDVIDAMVQMHYIMAPAASAAAWTELFMGLDYSHIVEGQARRLAKVFAEEELNELLTFAESPAFQKLVHTKAIDDLEAEEESNEWFIKIKSDFLTRAKYVFNKHNVDAEIYNLLVRSMQDLEDM